LNGRKEGKEKALREKISFRKRKLEGRFSFGPLFQFKRGRGGKKEASGDVAGICKGR